MNNIDFAESLQRALMFFVPFLFALCFHEFAHGWMAKRRGDRTAELMGRLTLNPTAHADPIGTVLLPLMAVITHIPLFGWAKPVPVNPRNLARPREDMFWIALAGPLSNILLAVVGAIGLGIFVRVMPEAIADNNGAASAAFHMTLTFIQVNAVLAVFNMIPLHPLDGGKVLARFLPETWNRWLEDMQAYSSWLLIAMFVFGMFKFVSAPAYLIFSNLVRLAGVPLG